MTCGISGDILRNWKRFLADTEVDCKQCESVLEGMEAIDDEAEAAGVPVVKVDYYFIVRLIKLL